MNTEGVLRLITLFIFGMIQEDFWGINIFLKCLEKNITSIFFYQEGKDDTRRLFGKKHIYIIVWKKKEKIKEDLIYLTNVNIMDVFLPGAENEDVWGQDRCCALEF
ncbi:hypothetical protein ACJX0J_018639 [Zea mays]